MDGQISFEFEQRQPIKGYPELHWTGKRPYTSTQYYPAQLKESYGEPKDGWMNKIFWGDNLQVMSHMLKEYRGKIDLIYIDPPFDSKVDYKKQIKIKSKKIAGDISSFEEKQYSDIWTNDEYLQFMYERLVIMRELLSSTGTIYVHCDYHKSMYIRCILDEIFGFDCMKNEITWHYEKWTAPSGDSFQKNHDTIFMYSKGNNKFNTIKEVTDNLKSKYENGYLIGGGYGSNGLVVYDKNNPKVKEMIASGKYQVHYADMEGKPISDVWDIPFINPQAKERTGYPTQKPEKLLERIITASTDPGDLVFDCFMGSGTLCAVAGMLNRKYIGADINLGAVQVTTKRLLGLQNNNNFEVYNVNNYDFFRNPVEAKELIIDALGIQKFDSSTVYDGELDGWMVKIMPTNRIATKADLEELKANLPYHTFEKRKEENPNGVVEKIKIICMGHEADLKASLEQELSSYNLEIEIVDILRDKKDLQFKREADANVVKENNQIIIKEFYPMNLLQKLSMQKESVEDWRQLVESIYIDWNYDGQTMRPTICDIPTKDELVSGIYKIPDSAGKIKIKITDLLSESLELEV